MDYDILNTALIVCVFMGIANVATMVKYATRNKQGELSKGTNRTLKIIGFIFALLAVSSVISSVANYSYVGRYAYSSYGEYQQLTYGRMCFSSLSFAFIYLGIALYLFFFKSSKSDLADRVIKVVLLLLLVFLYWLPVIFYPKVYVCYLVDMCFMSLNFAFLNSSKWNNDKIEPTVGEDKKELLNEFRETVIEQNEVLSISIENDESKNSDMSSVASEVVESDLPSVAIESKYSFCRFCGNKLVEGDKFCRNCGKSIN